MKIVSEVFGVSGKREARMQNSSCSAITIQELMLGKAIISLFLLVLHQGPKGELKEINYFAC